MLEVFANYGAMHPTEKLVIFEMSRGTCKARSTLNGEETTFKIGEIRHARPESGSPIGIYWNERDAY